MSKEHEPTEKTPAPAIPATVSAGVLASFAGISVPRVSQLKQEGIIPTPGKRASGYPFRESILAMFNDLRRRGAGRPGAAAEARTKEALATSAELDAAERLGDLVLKEDVKGLWADATIEVRRMIEDAEFLDAGKKAKILDRLGKIALAELPA